MAVDETWTFVAKALARGIDVCLITMVDSKGHGPNRPGCRLVVSADGKFSGTVGGGNSEYMLINEARAALAAACPQTGSRLIALDHHENGLNRGSGMICSGTQVFALTRLTGAEISLVQQIADAHRHGPAGLIRIDAEGLTFLATPNPKPVPSFSPDPWCYEEPVGLVDTAILIGGGHVSLALSPILASLGMRVMVLDNRAGLKTMEDNVFAHERRVVDYAAIATQIPHGDQSYVCIMTFGHQHDQDILERLVNLPFRYLGMMGSKPKVRQIRNNLLSRGVSAQALDQVHAPIGLPIGSNTPAEIAVSIAAEVIAVRRGLQGCRLFP